MVIKFSENLKILRKNANMTQGQLAKLLNVDQRTVSAWENNICEPNFCALEKLCEVFKEDLNGLLT